MLSIFSYLITVFGIFFWIFRVIVSLMYSMSLDFFCQPINANIEIAILFATIPCMLFIIKRSIIWATIYLGIYAAYFGNALYEAILSIQENGIGVVNTSNLIIVSLGVIIPLLTFLDILLNKNRRGHGGDKQTDWFYKNEQFDREFDERSDRNQYRL